MLGVPMPAAEPWWWLCLCFLSPCSHFPSCSPIINKKQLLGNFCLFFLLFSSRGKFHCAVHSGDSSACCSNFILLLVLPNSSRRWWGAALCCGAAGCTPILLRAVPRGRSSALSSASPQQNE